MAPSGPPPGPQSYPLCQVGGAPLPDTSPHSDSGAGPGAGGGGVGSGAWPGEPPREVMAGGRGCFAVGCVCLCVSVCVFGDGLQAGHSSFYVCLYHVLLAHCHQACGFSPSLSSSTSMPPTVDTSRSSAAFLPMKTCVFTVPTVSITHGAPQAFRGHKQALNPTVWQASAHPSSLTSMGGWLSQELLSSGVCDAGEWVMAAWSRTQGPFSAPPRDTVSLQASKAASVRRCPRLVWPVSSLGAVAPSWAHCLGDASGTSFGMSSCGAARGFPPLTRERSLRP